jgi:protease-4
MSSSMPSENSTPEKKSKTSKTFILTLGFLCFVVGSCSLTFYSSLNRLLGFIEDFNDQHSLSIFRKGDKKIAQFNIEGVIYGTREDVFEALENIEEGVKDKHISGVLVYINSPGGSVAPTQDIQRRLIELRKTVPVVCSFGDLAASGGYYLATACEKIFALPGTTTGSIGVIFQIMNVENLANWAKIKPVTIKSGKLKDVASPFRTMTPEEKKYLQTLLDEVHEQFIRDVAKGRENKITEANLRNVADGRILTGEQALKEGLVDQIGGPTDALRFLRKDKKLGEDSELLKLPHSKKGLRALFAESRTHGILDEVRPFLNSFHGLVPMLLPSYFQAP